MRTIIGADLGKAAEVLCGGGLVGIPTETVYGLAANALDPTAVLSIFETKNRPSFNPLIIHISSISQFEKYAKQVPDAIIKLAEKFCPGPITFVLEKKPIVPDIVTGGGNTVAIRIPNHPLTLKLLGLLEFPLAAPSANPFGYISPVTAMHVKEQLDGKIAYILDGGSCEVGIESTVVTWRDDQLIVLRAGGVSIDELREVYPDVKLELNVSSNPQSPGQLLSHYAPRVHFLLGNISDLLSQYPEKKIGVLSFSQPYAAKNILRNEILSSSASEKEAAQNLFAAMRRLDAAGIDLIIAEKIPEKGLGLAVNDRLQRAAANKI